MRGRNPMLVGIGAGEAARDFAQAIKRQNWVILPLELRGIKFLSIEKEVAELGNCGFEQLSIEKEVAEQNWMADYFKSGGTQSDEFAIGLNNTFQAIAGHDIGQFPGLESEKQVEPQACTAL